MANIFLSYKFTGEPYGPLRELLNKIEKNLTKKGHKVFCSIDLQQFYKKNGMSSYQSQLDYCLQQQKDSDTVIAIIKSEEVSNGMLAELKLSKKFQQKVFLIIKKGLKFKTFRNIAIQTIEFENENEITACVDKLHL